MKIFFLRSYVIFNEEFSGDFGFQLDFVDHH